MMATHDNLDNLHDTLCKYKVQMPDEIYNYAGYGIVENFFCDNADISCGFALGMNDHYEVITGAKEVLRQWHCLRIVSTCAYEVLLQNVEANYNIGQDCKLKEPQQVLIPYIFSMSSVRDSAYMWRNYVNDARGGYCIGLDTASLQESIRCRNALQGYTLSLRQVFYNGKNEHEISVLSRALASDVGEALNIFNKNPIHEGEAAKVIMGGVFSLAPHIKNKQWDNEQEWRLVFLNVNCDAVCIDDKYERKNTLLSTVSGNPAYFMSSIMISPQGCAQMLQDNINRFALPERAKKLLRSKLSQSVVKNYIEASKTDEANYAMEFLSYQDFVLEKTIKSKDAEVCSFAEFRRTKLDNGTEEGPHV